ncbi:MAG: GNAT family N-acyltransferase [Candidatus Sumerlaeia bacterium]|nr:GNAT family N-acyltransferase [Candidatus Sumerlaeia bacterium]
MNSLPQLQLQPLRLEALDPKRGLSSSTGADLLVIPQRGNAQYQVGFAISERSVDQVLRLRFEVFNLEMKEGLLTSLATGRDEDPFDSQMHHLVIWETATQRMIGTYRLQPASHALKGIGLYSASEYDLAPLLPLQEELLECGRACIIKEHRSLQTITMLWRGIRAYLQIFNLRYLFGCCSITTNDPDDGWRALKMIRQRQALHPEYLLRALASCSCGDLSRENDPALGEAIPLPKLFGVYLTMGGKVISEPAIDRAFGTVDFLILVDQKEVGTPVMNLVPTFSSLFTKAESGM